MKRQMALLVVLSALVLSTLACGTGFIADRVVRGSGVMATEERPVSDFDTVQFSGIGNLYIELGDKESLTIEAEDNLLPYIETDVRNGRLEIGLRRGITIDPTSAPDFYLTVVNLEEVAVSGLGSVEVPALAVDHFTVSISGGGDIDIDGLEAESLYVQISGLGDLTVHDGQVTSQEIAISGSGNYKALGLDSEEASVHISGLGSASLAVTEFLDVRISGAGTVEYLGRPTVNQNISGIGTLKQISG